MNSWLLLLVCQTAAPLSAEQMIDQLVQTNPTIRSAVADFEGAKRAAEGEAHRYRPQLTLGAGFTRNEVPNLSAVGVLVGRLDSLSLSGGLAHRFSFGTSVELSLELSRIVQEFSAPNVVNPVPLGPGYGVQTRLSIVQPLLRGFGVDQGEAPLRIAQANLTAAEQARLRVASDMIRTALEAYWELWYAQEALRIRLRAREVARQQLVDAEARAQIGAIAPLDVLPLRTDLATVEETLADAEVLVWTNWLALTALVVLPSDSVPQTLGPPRARASALDRAAAKELAVETAYELRELEAAVQSARSSLDLARDEAAPRLDASAWLAVQGLGDNSVGGAFNQFGGFDAVSAFVGVEGEIDLDGTRRRASEDQARFAVASSTARLQARRMTIEATANQLVRQISAANQKTKLTSETASVAAMSMRGQETRFSSGAVRVLDSIAAQQAYREAKLRVARAVVNRELLSLRLDDLTGQLWPR